MRKKKCHLLNEKYRRNKRRRDWFITAERGDGKEKRKKAEEGGTSKKKMKHFSEGKATRSEGFGSNKKF